MPQSLQSCYIKDPHNRGLWSILVPVRTCNKATRYSTPNYQTGMSGEILCLY